MYCCILKVLYDYVIGIFSRKYLWPLYHRLYVYPILEALAIIIRIVYTPYLPIMIRTDRRPNHTFKPSISYLWSDLASGHELLSLVPSILPIHHHCRRLGVRLSPFLILALLVQWLSTHLYDCRR